jgi:flagellar hook-basal body complex protein FliE
MIANSIQASFGLSELQRNSPTASEEMLAAAEEFIGTLKASEIEGAAALTGTGDPHELVVALAESKIAIEATVAIRDRAVEAYQELLRMPI